MTESSTHSGDYLLDNVAEDAGDRFGALSRLFDPVTARHLDLIGIRRGWRCWEVGAGGPSVPVLLRERVGGDGHIVATDVEVRWMDAARERGVEVLRHDVALEDPPGAGFDLVHARLVLVHLPDREVALRRMVAALRPGGWLLLEDFDTAGQPKACLAAKRPEEHLANHVRAGFVVLLGERGVDLQYGRGLPRLLRQAGLIGVTADGYFPVAMPAATALEIANINQVRGGLLARGLATAAEIDDYLEVLASGRLDVALPPLISAWGRRAG
jgi:SAM-dependent methyltransferase